MLIHSKGLQSRYIHLGTILPLLLVPFHLEVALSVAKWRVAPLPI